MKTFSEPAFNFTSFCDLLFNFLLIFIIIITLLKSREEGEPSLPPNVMYQLVMDWDGGSKTDLDLWAKDPMGRNVGFNNREGGENSLFSLAHDDLGARNDTVSVTAQLGAMPSVVDVPTVPQPVVPIKVVAVNQEIISLRGTKEGEYVVNGHCYYKESTELIVKATCKLVKIKPFKEIKKIEREFKTNGDEITFFRFKVDKDGNVTDVSELPQKIVTLNGAASPASN